MLVLVQVSYLWEAKLGRAYGEAATSGAAGTAAGMASSAASPDPGRLVRPRGGVGKLRILFTYSVFQNVVQKNRMLVFV